MRRRPRQAIRPVNSLFSLIASFSSYPTAQPCTPDKRILTIPPLQLIRNIRLSNRRPPHQNPHYQRHRLRPRLAYLTRLPTRQNPHQFHQRRQQWSKRHKIRHHPTDRHVHWCRCTGQDGRRNRRIDRDGCLLAVDAPSSTLPSSYVDLSGAWQCDGGYHQLKLGLDSLPCLPMKAQAVGVLPSFSCKLHCTHLFHGTQTNT